MFACCDAGTHFTETGFFYLGNHKDQNIDALFQKKEKNILYKPYQNYGSDKYGLIHRFQGQ